MKLPFGFDQLLYYAIETNVVYKTVFAYNNNVSEIVIPAGQTLRHYDSQPLVGTNTAMSIFPGRTHPKYKILDGQAAFDLQVVEAGFELPGPSVLQIIGGSDERLRLFTFTVSSINGILENSFIKVTGGRTAVLVEESEDLHYWTPLFFGETERNSSRFFRLRIGD